MEKTKSSIWIIPAFGAVYFIWGTTYLANVYALKSIPPFIISALRYTIAGLLLAGIAYGTKARFPDKRDSKNLIISGVLMLVGGSGLVVVAEQNISSSAAAVIVATEPLWFVLLDKARWKWYFANKAVIAGLLIGFSGISLFACQTSSGPVKSQAYHWLGVAVVILSCILWVTGTLFSARRIKSGSYNPWHTTVQLLAAGVFSSVIAFFDREWNHFQVTLVPWSSWSGLAFLIVFGSMIAYLAFAWLITVQPPAVVSTHTYVNPLIAVFIGWLIASEQVKGIQIIALGIALAGVILTQLTKLQGERVEKQEEMNHRTETPVSKRYHSV